MTLRRLPLLAAALVGLLLVAAACTDSDDDAPLLSAVGPGISIAEALSSTLDQPLLVNGFLVVQGDAARLCEALLESFPPQCGGASLLIEGLDLGAFADLSTEQDTTWSEQPLQLLGDVEDGVLTISSLVSG